ncbi:F-actin-monooxygenase MICAL3 isoform X8 [Acyrthosiphon pisum]|uniref:LIM zinc-binding domain-containing protein n=1 Tax=Acyrthosiphon pisum TaxID=7029 RepID=A0A8R2A9Q5_ACYPI|nr:F-actin-monooxygenase MICAL3 isoform X8 [Acyrthosiphon pisum]|eukprot:XP_003246991.1 PREDICTED: protein-methionine sulfoxide oxidase MICAL3 isoform X7 [Acyrthosiphon pisum]
MAGVNNVSTYDNAPENSNNTVEQTNKADDSDDKDDSLQNVIDNELSKRFNESETPANRVKYSVDIMLTAESIHSDSVRQSNDVEYVDLKSLKSNEYQVQKDTSELFLLTEKQHTEETSDDTGLSSEVVLILEQVIDNDGPLSDTMSSGFEEDGVTRELVDQDRAELEEPRIFSRPLPVDEADNVTELVFDTWTTVDEIVGSEIKKTESNGYEEKPAIDISAASINQECFDINTPAITNCVTEVVSETTTERRTVKKKSSAAGGEASTTVVKTKKTKKSKKSDEKENISVKSSFGKFDQLEKKIILQQRSPTESEKLDTKQNGVIRPEVNSVCKSCEKTVYAMEQIKAERQVWHKNCFRCTTCNKQLTLDIYSSHEGILYCKPHFKELFKPKVVVEDEEPIRRKKPEMIIRENQPLELPPDVVRASDKPDLGLEELSSLNVKSRFQAFENATTNGNSHMEKSPVSVKRSPSILSKLAKFQSKGMDVGVANDDLNGAFFEPSSSSDTEDEDTGNDMLKNSISKEKPMSFDKMESVKRNWEMRREEMKEEHKQEIQNIRSKLFAGKQGKMKQMYEQAVAESERTGVKRDININKSDKAKVIKEKFERGEIVNTESDDIDENNVPVNEDEDEMSVFEAGISKKSRSLFMELDANAVKTKQAVPIVNTKKEYIPIKQVTPIYSRQVSDDVVKCSDRIEDVSVETAEVSSKFKFFETYKPPAVIKKQFRITPPREGQIKGESPERDIYRDPNVVRSEDPVDETAELVKSNTTAKMLSLFRQMEVARPAVPEGLKPLKRFTPPPPDLKESETESESDDDVSGEDDSDEDSSSSETNDDVVKSSLKVEDEFLKNSQSAVMAKSLKDKFEHWEPDKHSMNNAVTMLDSEQESIESTKSLRARFESLKGDRPADKPKPKVNRFVQDHDSHAFTLCESCEKKVYPLEKVEIEGRPFHRSCFRCTQCQCVLRMDTFTWNNNRLYCLPHFKRLFISKGNYDEGFGGDQHKKKWENGHMQQALQVAAVTAVTADSSTD